jgi:hypothetical protein
MKILMLVWTLILVSVFQAIVDRILGVEYVSSVGFWTKVLSNAAAIFSGGALFYAILSAQ